MLKPGSDPDEGDEALRFYAKHTAQIEVKDCSPEDDYETSLHLACGVSPLFKLPNGVDYL